jgi:hypothetical protein
LNGKSIKQGKGRIKKKNRAKSKGIKGGRSLSLTPVPGQGKIQKTMDVGFVNGLGTAAGQGALVLLRSNTGLLVKGDALPPPHSRPLKDSGRATVSPEDKSGNRISPRRGGSERCIGREKKQRPPMASGKTSWRPKIESSLFCTY